MVASEMTEDRGGMTCGRGKCFYLGYAKWACAREKELWKHGPGKSLATKISKSLVMNFTGIQDFFLGTYKTETCKKEDLQIDNILDHQTPKQARSAVYFYVKFTWH